MCKSTEDRQAAIDSLIRHHKDIVEQLTTALISEIGKILRKDQVDTIEVPVPADDPSALNGWIFNGVETVDGKLFINSVRLDGSLMSVAAENAGLPMLIEAYEKIR